MLAAPTSSKLSNEEICELREKVAMYFATKKDGEPWCAVQDLSLADLIWFAQEIEKASNG